jgi:hypothetical protein
VTVIVDALPCLRIIRDIRNPALGIKARLSDSGAPERRG